MIKNNYKVITYKTSNYNVITHKKSNYKIITSTKNNYKVITKLLLYYIVITFPLSGSALTFSSPLQDGQLVYGTVDKDETLFIQNQFLNIGKNDQNLYQIQTNSEGSFVLGIPQDATHLQVTLKKDGKLISKSYPVKLRSWQEEIVSGLQPEKVSPSPQNSTRIASEAQEIRLARQKTNYLTFPQHWIHPIHQTYRMSSAFGSRRILNNIKKQGHSGVDYACPTGTPIYAPAPGKVVYINPDVFLTGKTIMIDHGFGVFSSYSHLNHISVKLNQIVTPSDIIGQVGSTGRSSGPHLHFTVTWFGIRINPEDLFNPHSN